MLILAALAILIVLLFGRVLYVFARLAFALLAIGAVLVAVRTIASVVAQVDHAVTATHMPIGAALVVGAAVAVLAVIGAASAFHRARAALQPFVMNLRLSVAAHRLRSARRIITATSLATAAHVDRLFAVAWLARHPRFMPSPLNVAAQAQP